MILSESIVNFFPTDKPTRNELRGVLFVLVTEGEAKVEIDEHSYTLNEGVLLAILPSHLLYTVACSSNFRCKALAFTFDEMFDFPYMLESAISQKMERTPSVQLNSDESAKLERWYELLSSHAESTLHPFYSEISRSLIFIFTVEVSAIYCTKPAVFTPTHDKELTDGFFSLLHANCRMSRSTAFYSDKLCVSTKQLSRVIYRVTGHTTTYWIADFVIKEAKTLLKSSSQTVTQISETLNFPNSSFFARYFRKHTNISPQRFRIK